MRKLLGHLAFCAGLGVLISAMGAPVARAATIYEITVTITDITTSTVTSFKIDKGDPNDTNLSPNAITADGAFLTASSAASGLTFTSLSSSTVSGPKATSLQAESGFTLNPGVTDHYLVSLQTTHDTFTTPPAAGSTILFQSTSGTYSFTTAANTQSSQSWYSPTNTANSTLPPGTPPAIIAIPATGDNGSGSSPTVGTLISPYVVPYALTNLMKVDVTGNGFANNSSISASSSTTLASVPEPASVVVLLTGMPLPLVVVGLLRRRRRAAA